MQREQVFKTILSALLKCRAHRVETLLVQNNADEFFLREFFEFGFGPELKRYVHMMNLLNDPKMLFTFLRRGWRAEIVSHWIVPESLWELIPDSIALLVNFKIFTMNELALANPDSPWISLYMKSKTEKLTQVQFGLDANVKKMKPILDAALKHDWLTDEVGQFLWVDYTITRKRKRR